MGFFDEINLNQTSTSLSMDTFSWGGNDVNFRMHDIVGDQAGIDSFLDPPTKKIRISSIRDLKGFVRIGSHLINKSTKDLWSLKRDANGNYFIERLFTEDEQPNLEDGV